ncbi:23S rRNA (adenine-N6)-dimethyltransferase [Prauserella isguenensis]|uniref:23S rRNA (Adenine-N6)-dimethyltransferase n=1 Tax=Prauserella isguenensis TaxID=1470180 RepID=A0A839S4I1_9PSEU|nr:23S rRNA (adenine-N6)-dimethyltransferase [Prauserella isguenensis]
MSRHSGRHELGQNFLTDRATIARIVDHVARTDGPIIEIGAGEGAVTLPLETLDRPITAVELDGRLVATLRPRVRRTRVVHADFGGFDLPRTPHVIVGNLPFHRTTGMLRRVLAADHWTDAVLLVQWEVARRRAGVGGATMMTAQWWPWFEFGLDRRVPASAFTPRPDVDGGLLTITRRPRPFVPQAQRRDYADLVHDVFTGPGRGIEDILTRRFGHRAAVGRWLADNGVPPTVLPRGLTARQWAALHALAEQLPVRRPGGERRSAGRSRPRRR